MPQLDSLGMTIWLLQIAVEVALSVILFQRKCWKGWRSVCVFVWFRTGVSLLLLATYFDAWGYDNSAPVYFYTYWISAGVAGLLQLWIITDIACAVAPVVGRILRGAIPMLAGVYLCGALFLVGNSPLTFPLESTRMVVNLDRAASLSWLGAFICLSFASDILGIRWRYRALGVAIGFTLQAIGETGISWLLGALPGKWPILSNAQGIIWLIALIVWARTFLKAIPPAEAPIPTGELLTLSRSLLVIVKRYLRPR